MRSWPGANLTIARSLVIEQVTEEQGRRRESLERQLSRYLGKAAITVLLETHGRCALRRTASTLTFCPPKMCVDHPITPQTPLWC